MAAGGGEEELPEATSVAPADAGRAAPALRKQQGPSRLASADAERLGKLRKENSEFRHERERTQERQQLKKEEMAEAYKKKLEETRAKVKEDRRMQMARLEGQQKNRSMTLNDRSLTLSDKEDEIVDEEYLMLLEKYGDRVRVPLIPSNPWKMRSISSLDSGGSGRLPREESPRRPARPKSKPAGGGNRTSTASAVGGATSSTATAASINAAEKKKAQRGEGHSAASRGSATQQAAHAGGAATLPPLATAGGAARPNPVSTHDVLAGDSESEIPEPERSLMPRKDALRKFQQQLLKNTDVSFYKSHLKKHLRRILEATELTFTDHEGRREQANWNLAKPLTMAELKQLSSVSPLRAGAV